MFLWQFSTSFFFFKIFFSPAFPLLANCSTKFQSIMSTFFFPSSPVQPCSLVWSFVIPVQKLLAPSGGDAMLCPLWRLPLFWLEHRWLEWSALTLSYRRVLCGGKLQKPTIRKHKESKLAQHKACACKVVAQREGCQLRGCCGMWLSSPGLLALSQEGQQLSCSLPLWHLISKRRDPQASSGLGSEK